MRIMPALKALRSGRAHSSPFRWFAALLVALLLTPDVAAQQVPQLAAPPLRSVVDRNGVDLITGRFGIASTDVSIGPPGPGGLSLTRFLAADGWRHSYQGYLYSNAVGPEGDTFVVSLGDRGEYFYYFPPDYVVRPESNSGSTLTLVNGDRTTGNFLYTDATGFEARFFVGYRTNEGTIAQSAGELRSIRYPSGEMLTFTYDIDAGPVPCGPGSGACAAGRLRSVRHSLGYQMKFEYDTVATERLLRVTALNEAIDYCSPTAASCPNQTYIWPAVAYTVSGTLHTTTDALGRVTQFQFAQADGVHDYQLQSVRYGTSGPNAISLTWNGSGTGASVATYTDNLGTWTYGYAPGVTTVQNPLQQTRTVHRNSYGKVSRDIDELGRETTLQYDSGRNLIAIQYPGGNRVDMTRDDRGNITSSTLTPRAGSGLANIVTSASFDATCSNRVTCNRPNSITDAAGYRTDYTYDPVHGGVLTATSPAPGGATPIGSGVRPQLRNTYSQVFAWYKNSSGAIVQSTSSVWRPTSISSCATLSACTGSSDETRTVISYQVGSSSSASNVLPLSETRRSGDGILSATTTTTFTPLGDPASIDGPRTDVGDIVTYRYDAMRQRIGEVHPDPDGGGPLQSRAIRTAYRQDGQTTSVEYGAMPGPSEGDWANFAVNSATTTEYDIGGRRIRQNAFVGGILQNVTQYSYDQAGQLQCTAVRMNSDVFASLPSSACSLSTQGLLGPDRITRLTLDAAGQVTTEQRAYGTGQQQDYARITYAANGLRETVRDANNNRTTFEYDGFDRLSRTRYSVVATNANQSSTTDFEELSYDANDRILSRRVRSGETIAYVYDNLGRETLKDLPGGAAADVYSSYDLLGRRLFARFASVGGSGIEFSYDALSRVLTETGYGRQLTYAYDASGNRTRLTYPDGNYIQYSFDNNNRMDQVRENGATSGAGVLADYGYDTLGRRTSIARGNGTTTTFGYAVNARGWFLNQDMAGENADLTVSLTFGPSTQVATRAFSSSGYRYAPPNLSQGYTSDGLNRYATVSGGALSYDSRGNLTVRGSRTYNYDVENRLVAVGGDASVSLAYDPLGRLRQVAVGAATKEFLYDGGRLVAEYSNGAVTQRYVHGATTDEPLVWYEGSGLTNRKWLHADDLGSIIATTDSSGAAVAMTYGAYGEPANDIWTGPRFRFTGQIALPEARLYHFKARVYDPVIGRYLQTDPIGYQDGLNLYLYAYNDPLNFTDPRGTDAWLVSRGVDFFDKNHLFVVIADCLGCRPAEIYSFGPQRDNISDPGQLVALRGNTESDTFLDDNQTWENIGANNGNMPEGVGVAQIEASDESVRTIAQATEGVLGTADNPGRYRYHLTPNRFSLRRAVNSNSASYGIAIRAVRLDGGLGQFLPRGFDHPGWGEWGNIRLPPIVIICERDDDPACAL